jgi:hypothetical protein
MPRRIFSSWKPKQFDLLRQPARKTCPRKLRRLFKNKLDKEHDAKLRQAADEYKAVGETDLATHRSTPTEHHSGGIPSRH